MSRISAPWDRGFDPLALIAKFKQHPWTCKDIVSITAHLDQCGEWPVLNARNK
jgi:hypothetical protein